MWIKRKIRSTLERVVDERPVVLVTGARQAGKTSLLENAFPNYNYVCLDEPLEAEQAEQASTEFLERHTTPVIIEEVQYAPKLLRALKLVVDNDRSQTGRYLLTGSQKFGLMQGVSESLAGRVSVLQLHSLSIAELESVFSNLDSRKNLLEILWQGGYPELHARGLDPRRFYADYVATYLERDVRQALNVRSLRDFDRFLRLCATRTGQLLNMNGLASDVGVSPNTIRSWLSVLEASNIIFLLAPFYRNLGKRLVKSAKLYFLDTGLLCHLVGLRSPGEIERSALLGPLFESLALGQIVRAYADQGLSAPIYFYRDHHGHEVDFVIPIGERAHLIECKWAENPTIGRGMNLVASLLGESNVLSRSCITPGRIPIQTSQGFTLRNPVDFAWLLDV